LDSQAGRQVSAQHCDSDGKWLRPAYCELGHSRSRSNDPLSIPRNFVHTLYTSV
jgi:hypothetical protein